MEKEIITSIKPKTNLNWALEVELSDSYEERGFNFKELVKELKDFGMIERIKEALIDNINQLTLKDFSLKFEQY